MMNKVIGTYLLVGLCLLREITARSAPIQWLSDYPTAKCLDGTTAAYFYEPASTTADANKWVIYLAGGGECDKASACQAQTTNSLGSSKYFAQSSDANYWYLSSDNCTSNPYLCTYNHVLDPYCTQDLHSGRITNATEETFGLYFAGHLVLKATLDDLDKKHNLADATEIILFGVSAGGIGVWMNVDYIADRYPNAKVTAATVAGHYFYANYYTGPNHTNPGSMGDFQETALPSTYTLYDAFVDVTCKEAYESRGQSAGACLLSNNSIPYIESDAFVVQAQTDITVLTGHDCFPDAYKYEEPEQQFMEDFHHNMTIALTPFMSGEVSPRRGGFAAACYTHTSFYAGYPTINGLDYYHAFNNFYVHYKDVSPSDYQLQDDCGLMCNPTCA